jgi:hypothetical protein
LDFCYPRARTPAASWTIVPSTTVSTDRIFLISALGHPLPRQRALRANEVRVLNSLVIMTVIVGLTLR